jgi:hypothetical protein
LSVPHRRDSIRDTHFVHRRNQSGLVNGQATVSRGCKNAPENNLSPFESVPRSIEKNEKSVPTIGSAPIITADEHFEQVTEEEMSQSGFKVEKIATAKRLGTPTDFDRYIAG